MIDTRIMDNMIYKEFDEIKQQYWFNFKKKKFLHNIDTFYYSVLLYDDFSKTSESTEVSKLRRYFKNFNTDSFDVCVPVNFKGFDEQLNFRNFSFSGYYKYCIECPDMFDIFIAETVPTDITVQVK